MVLSGPKQLDAMMKEGTLPGLLLLWGEDAPLMAGYKRRLERWAVTAFPDFNRSQYDGRFPLDLEALGDAARSLPMMAPRRFVLVEDLDPGLLSTGGLEKLRQLAEELPEETLLVMTMGSVLPDLKKKGSKGAQVFQLCERLGGVCHFPKPAGSAAVQRMVSAAEKAGSSISKDAAQLLAEYCGREPQRMLTEVQKLAAHSPEGITPEDVLSLVAPVTEARVFDLPDKIIARNFTAAMAAINDLVFLRESPVSILSILSMAFVDLYRAGVARKAGIPDAEAKKALGYGGSGYRYDQGAQNQRKFSIPTLERILELLAEADKQMKTTGPDARVVLETTVAEIFREMEGA